jgi:hypothetical protein
MRSPKRNRRLQFEVMESREVLSASLAGASLASPALVNPPPREPPVPLPFPLPTPREVVLNGLLSGSYSAFSGVDTISYDLSGQGQVQPLGPMTVTGHLNFLLPGHVGGTLTLSNSQGTLTLTLTGPLQRGVSPLPTPNLFAFAITGGTGAFTNATGRGTASLQLVADPLPGVPPFSLVRHSQGHFDLLLVGNQSPLPPQSQM